MFDSEEDVVESIAVYEALLRHGVYCSNVITFEQLTQLLTVKAERESPLRESLMRQATDDDCPLNCGYLDDEFALCLSGDSIEETIHRTQWWIQRLESDSESFDS